MRKSDVKQSNRYGEKFNPEAGSQYLAGPSLVRDRYRRRATEQHYIEMFVKTMLAADESAIPVTDIPILQAWCRRFDAINRRLIDTTRHAVVYYELVEWLAARGLHERLGWDLYRKLVGHYPQGLRITSPVSGAVWPIASGQTITWDIGTDPGPVVVVLSRDGGRQFPFPPIVPPTANDGTEPWVVTGPASDDCYIWIINPATGVRWRFSGRFTIV